MSVALAIRKRSRSDVRLDSPSLAWSNRDRAPSPRNNAPNSPSLLGVEEVIAPAAVDPETDMDKWEAGGRFGPVFDTDMPNLPSESSPSLRSAPGRAVAVVPILKDDGAGTFCIGESSSVAPGTRVVRLKERLVRFNRAPCKRASRAARPSEPSQVSRSVCMQLIQTREVELKRGGRTRLAADDIIRYRSGSASGGRGPSVRAQVENEQARMNHLAALKARNVESYNTEASFLLWGNTSEQCYDKLAESALRANAGGAAITKRKDTQGAAFQSERAFC